MDRREIIRRRGLSIVALEAIERERFNQKYQETCDSLYWSKGQCCAGCDYWASEHSLAGQCTDSPKVSGQQVMKSLGAICSSYDPGPDFPFTNSEEWCGRFKDDFDWSELEESYLLKIGALSDGALRAKPRSPVTTIGVKQL